jgi:hypothetical protein
MALGFAVVNVIRASGRGRARAAAALDSFADRVGGVGW